MIKTDNFYMVLMVCDQKQAVVAMIRSSLAAVIKLDHASKLPGVLTKTHISRPTLRVSDSVDLGCILSVCIFQFPDDADAVSLGTTLIITSL